MYYYPFWLLTPDETRNLSVADRIEEELDRFARQRLAFWTELEDQNLQPAETKESFEGLLDIQREIDGMYLDVARCNLAVLNGPLPQVDHFRIKDKVKKLMGSLRRRCIDLDHQ